jgi:hypothetical protein
MSCLAASDMLLWCARMVPSLYADKRLLFTRSPPCQVAKRHRRSADQPQRHPRRVFFAQFHLDTLQSWLATAESIVGIVIEGVCLAMLIQRLFR